MVLEIDAAAEIFLPGSCIPHYPDPERISSLHHTAESLILFDGVECGYYRGLRLTVTAEI